MVASRSEMADVATVPENSQASARSEARRQRLIAAGGILGALAASSCCIVPLILFSLGIGGAWIGNLTALAPYKPLFVAATAGFLGYGFYLVYWKPRQPCSEGAVCARPIPNRLVRFALWIATVLVAAAFSFDYVAPLLLRA
ncbi:MULTISPECIES: mercuric transporter MerT family protein [unclassified Bradyrhizobium]|uniref:mercuric transporter MerT family protein n=1 Tax=unclassified Bradyrhizobium TaxID=2631580 RepID=UPI002478701B|nr:MULTISPECIES: mercuric transporter MerT family protein [unclassified Bradyrhizobium]WGS20264.1 mercuric transporter MerT family protein [Bradyrhizobium sp. ISRA463]WGS27136.1 mercuric transporter MerT family protein [Bradyrhizobium sp. ISRA464]